jgi:hypothetical protein
MNFIVSPFVLYAVGIYLNSGAAEHKKGNFRRVREGVTEVFVDYMKPS